MRLNVRDFLGRKVETVSGAVLGRVHDLVFDIESFSIVCLLVRVSRIAPDEYRIAESQIVRIEEKRVIVHDTTLQNKKQFPSSSESSQISPAPVLREEIV